MSGEILDSVWRSGWAHAEIEALTKPIANALVVGEAASERSEEPGE
jgi:hypothetical protein